MGILMLYSKLTFKRVTPGLLKEILLVAVVWNVPDTLPGNLAQRENLKPAVLS